MIQTYPLARTTWTVKNPDPATSEALRAAAPGMGRTVVLAYLPSSNTLVVETSPAPNQEARGQKVRFRNEPGQIDFVSVGGPTTSARRQDLALGLTVASVFVTGAAIDVAHERPIGDGMVTGLTAYVFLIGACFRVLGGLNLADQERQQAKFQSVLDANEALRARHGHLTTGPI